MGSLMFWVKAMDSVPYRLGICIHRCLRIVYACDLMPGTEYGAGTRFSHSGLGVVIHPDVRIGKNCTILHNVTVGGAGPRGVPVIGDNVLIGAGAIVIGPVVIGDNAKIGAGALVNINVPAGATAVGNPARIIKKAQRPED